MPAPPFPDQANQAPQKYFLHQYKGVNVNVPRASVADGQYAWLENLFTVGPGAMRAMWDAAPAIFTTPGASILQVIFYNIGTSPFAAVFLSDGTAYQVNIVSGAQTTISATPGQFYQSGPFIPSAVQFNANGIVIVTEATNPNGYYAWDGTTLFSAGQNSPPWLVGFATFPIVMPSGVHGNAVEIYQNRVWVVSPPQNAQQAMSPFQQLPAVITTATPVNGADFNIGDGANITPQQDSTLRFQYNALKQSNGFLWLFGDSNISVISNVQISGSPAVTTYSFQNVDPQVGATWMNTVQVYGQAIIFANQRGVFLMLGATAQKISHELDIFFTPGGKYQADFSTTPSAAVAEIFGVLCYCINLRIPDQNNNFRNIICVWNGQDWRFATQLNSMQQIYSQEFNGVLTAWGTDGTHLQQLFQVPNSALNKVMISKLVGAGNDDDMFITYKKNYRYYMELVDYSGAGVSITGTIDSGGTVPGLVPTTPLSLTFTPTLLQFVNNSSAILIFVNFSSQPINFGVPTTVVQWTDATGYGTRIGYSLNTITGADFTIEAMALLYATDAPLGG